jgi:hypothetical protein
MNGIFPTLGSCTFHHTRMLDFDVPNSQNSGTSRGAAPEEVYR